MESVLVCGGRNYQDQALVFGALDMENEINGIGRIIQGGANGADRIARLWCNSRKVRYDNYPPDWGRFGKGAGPKRNQQMLDEGQPTKVFAFPGDRGTSDMVRRARSAGIPVHQFKDES